MPSARSFQTDGASNQSVRRLKEFEDANRARVGRLWMTEITRTRERPATQSSVTEGQEYRLRTYPGAELVAEILGGLGYYARIGPKQSDLPYESVGL
jgi:hypothetical protein